MNNIKQWIAAVMAVCAVGTLSLPPVKAADLPVSKISYEDMLWYGDLGYTVMPDGTVSIAFGPSVTEIVEVPASIDNKAVTQIGDEAFSFQSHLTSVKLPDSVTTICNKGFNNCTGLQTLTLGKGIQVIQDAAFIKCTSLTDVYYAGTKADFSKVYISDMYNDPLTSATIHCSDGIFTPTGIPSRGNLDGDAEVSASDASILLMAAAAIGASGDCNLTLAQKAAADVNGDGELDATDASIILRYAAAVGAGNTGAKLTDFI